VRRTTSSAPWPQSASAPCKRRNDAPGEARFRPALLFSPSFDIFSQCAPHDAFAGIPSSLKFIVNFSAPRAFAPIACIPSSILCVKFLYEWNVRGVRAYAYIHTQQTRCRTHRFGCRRCGCVAFLRCPVGRTYGFSDDWQHDHDFSEAALVSVGAWGNVIGRRLVHCFAPASP